MGIPWLVRGNFNEIVQYQEKHGGDLWPERQMQQFYNILDCCSLQDLGFESHIFTWCNGWEGDSSISKRLDHFVANKEWQAIYTYWQVSCQTVTYSNHVLILLSFRFEPKTTTRKRPFHFETMWTDVEECSQIISRYWNSSLTTEGMHACSHEMDQGLQ